MTLKLYKFSPGPTVRAVLITGAAIGLKFKEQEVDVPNGEHLKEEFINPLSTLPTLDDDGKVLYDSHAINAYLVDMYGKNDELYPKDVYERALINQALAFDMGILFPILVNLNQCYFKKEITSLTPQWISTLENAYDRLEKVLKNGQWMSLDHIAIGDFSCYTTATSLDYHLPVDPAKYPNVKDWMNRCKELPYFHGDGAYMQTFIDLMSSRGAKPYIDSLKMAPPRLYVLHLSPAVRAVLIVTEAIDLKLDIYELDMLNGEHLTEKYLKLNPLHSVPTLDDNGNALYDSHAINGYIVDKYGKDESWYPKDVYKRSLVEQGTAFDMGILFPILKEVDLAYFKKEITSLSPKMVEGIKSAYDFLEKILEKTGWVSLDKPTLADISCYTTTTSLDFHLPINSERYPNISGWVKRCAKLPCFKNDNKHLETFFDMMKMINAVPYKE